MASAEAETQRRTGAWLRDHCPGAVHVRTEGFHRLPERLLHRVRGVDVSVTAGGGAISHGRDGMYEDEEDALGDGDGGVLGDDDGGFGAVVEGVAEAILDAPSPSPPSDGSQEQAFKQLRERRGQSGGWPWQTLVFVTTFDEAEAVADGLEVLLPGLSVACLHRNLPMAARRGVMSALKGGAAPSALGQSRARAGAGSGAGARARAGGASVVPEVDVLVATDLAARGLDARGVGHVVQVGPATDLAQMLHRCGRTARAGWSGTVTTLTRSEEERSAALQMEERARGGARDAISASRDAQWKRRRLRKGKAKR